MKMYVIKIPVFDSFKNILHSDLVICNYEDGTYYIEKYSKGAFEHIPSSNIFDNVPSIIRFYKPSKYKITNAPTYIHWTDISLGILVFDNKINALISKIFLVNEIRKKSIDKLVFDKTIGYNSEELILEMIKYYPEYII